MVFAFIGFLLSGCSRKNTLYSNKKHNNLSSQGKYINYADTEKSLKFPFQVLHSKNVDINRYDLVAKNDTIQLNNNGYLILVHFSGKMLEFQGNTQINISEENRKINEYLNIGSEETNHRFRLSNIFSESDEYRYMYLNDDLIIQCLPYYEITFSQPYFHSRSGNYGLSRKNHEVCFKWKMNSLKEQDLSKKKFKITFKDIYDRKLKDSIVIGNQIQMDFSEYFKKEDKKSLLIYQVAEFGNPETTSGNEGVIFGAEPFYIPRSSCEVNTALEAFELGNYLERNKAPIKESQYYYQLATQLSKNPIYQELYSYFKKRKQLD